MTLIGGRLYFLIDIRMIAESITAWRGLHIFQADLFPTAETSSGGLVMI
jgi:hypothetical protein